MNSNEAVHDKDSDNDRALSALKAHGLTPDGNARKREDYRYP